MHRAGLDNPGSPGTLGLSLMKSVLFRSLAAAMLSSLMIPAAFGVPWTTDYAKALEQANTEDKAILLDFTGSDWCGWCMKMKQETLDTARFRAYAEKNLVLVEVDFPHNKPQPASVKKQNETLSQKFGADGYPTFVLLSKGQKVLWKQVGYLQGGPDAFLGEVKKVYHPAASSATGDDFGSFFKKPAATPAP